MIEFAGFAGIAALLIGLFSWVQRAFAQLESRMNDRFDRIDTRLNRNDTQFEHFRTRFEERLDAIEKQLTIHEGGFKETKDRFDGLETRFHGLETRFDGLETQTNERFKALQRQVAKLEGMLELLVRTLGISLPDKLVAPEVS